MHSRLARAYSCTRRAREGRPFPAVCKYVLYALSYCTVAYSHIFTVVQLYGVCLHRRTFIPSIETFIASECERMYRSTSTYFHSTQSLHLSMRWAWRGVCCVGMRMDQHTQSYRMHAFCVRSAAGSYYVLHAVRHGTIHAYRLQYPGTIHCTASRV